MSDAPAVAQVLEAHGWRPVGGGSWARDERPTTMDAWTATLTAQRLWQKQQDGEGQDRESADQ